MRRLLLLSLLALPAASAAEPPLDLVIAGGRIVDGSGAPWFRADVGLRGDRIVSIGDLARAPARRRIDVHDAMVAPGFIDLLGQSEWEVLVDNRVESKIRQGITTEVTGEGQSIAPQNPAMLAEVSDWLERYRLKVDWTDLAGYARRLARDRSTINVATFVGAAQVRGVVLGLGDVQPTEAHLRAMEAEVARAMEQGALGLSSALWYAPGSYAKTAELVALARVAARHGGIYASHIRDEGEHEMEALEEALTIGREARIPVEIWHLKAAGRPSWGHLDRVLARIERARAEGIDVTADMYPYDAAMNGLDAAIPGWAHAGGVDAMVARLKDPAARERIKREMAQSGQYRDVGADGILLASCLSPSLRRYMGKRLPEVAREMGRSPEDARLDLVAADRANVLNVLFMMDEKDVRLGLAQPWIAFDTDHPGRATDGPFAEQRAHPRGFGAAARLLGHYARDLKLFSVEEAVRKMTSLPARRVGLLDRGLLRPGLIADLVVFDPARVRDVATYDDPNRHAEGITHVVVNGKLVLDGGQLTAERPGRFLRRKEP